MKSAAPASTPIPRIVERFAVIAQRPRRNPPPSPLYTATQRMPRLVASIAIALALTAGVAACGGDEKDSTVVGAAKAHEAALELDGRAPQGNKVWTTAGCGACHTLSASRSTGTSAPNLDEVRPSATLVVDRVALGFQAMPTYQGLLTPQQMADVGEYVAEATRK